VEYRKLKKELRKLLGQRIEDMCPAEMESGAHQICKTITGMPSFIQSRNILLYASLPDEVRTDEFLLKLWKQKDKKVILPKVNQETGEIELYAVRTANELLHGVFGVREPLPEVCEKVDPAIVDCALVPGRGFDERGHRLGRGKAYYDQLLSRMRKETELIGVFFECQKAEFIPDEPHDWKLHFVVTETKVYEFTR